MSKTEAQQIFIQQLSDLEENEVLATAYERLAQNEDPLAIIEDAQEGMRRVGVRYEQGEYYLAALIMAAEIFSEIMELVQPVVETQISSSGSGIVLLGTVQGDIHDIGKNIISILSSCYGFVIHDLGVDVSPEVFVAQAEALKPDLIGLSGLITASFEAMAQTITLLRASEAQTGRRTPIIIGGSQLDGQVCNYVGADYWVRSAMDGVLLFQRLLPRG
jgi:methanogenic corrinoid protein MtbC1